jgi:hypothetical protein
MTWDAELEAFKTRIDLREYAAAQGYVQDRSESTKTGTAFVMRREGDKISICKKPNGHYVYYSFRDRRHGSIVDFVQRLKGVNLGEVRKELRRWLDSAFRPPVSFPKLEPQEEGRMVDLGEFRKMTTVQQYIYAETPRKVHAYLETVRRIPLWVLEHDRFSGRILTDERGNAIFPHYDRFPLFESETAERVEPCGWEIKNNGFTGFAKGGTKGLWISADWIANDMMIVCESAIDALSHTVLFPEPNPLYVSIAGDLSQAQALMITLLAGVVEPEETSFKVVAAMDADVAGARLADTVLTAATLSGRKGLECFLQFPSDGYKDWNEVLVARWRSIQ